MEQLKEILDTVRAAIEGERNVSITISDITVTGEQTVINDLQITVE